MPLALARIADFKRAPESRKTLNLRVLRIIAKTLATFANETPGEQSPGVLLSSGLLEVKVRAWEDEKARPGAAVGPASGRA